MEKDIEDLTETQKMLILLLGAKNFEPIINHLRLQKIFFYSLLLISESEEEKKELLEAVGFYPHKFGPYSETLEEDVEQLSLAGIIEYESLDEKTKNIRLTEKGKNIFNYLVKQFQEDLIKILEEAKDFLNDEKVTDKEVLAFIYTLEKDYTAKSNVIDLIEKNKVKYAINLYKKGKISIERASEIAEKSISDFKKLL